MKKVILILLMFIGLTACSYNRVNKTQHGVVVDVEYRPAYTTSQVVPVRVGKVTTTTVRKVHHQEQWIASICFEDTIYVQESFSHEVHVGDSTTRNIVFYERTR